MSNSYSGSSRNFDIIKNLMSRALREKDAGYIDEARRLFQEAANIDLTNQASVHAWAMMEKQQGNFDEARELFIESIRRNEKDSYGYLNLAIMEDELENYQVARKLFLKAVESKSNQLAPLQAYSLFELEQGNVDLALELAETAAEQFPNDFYALYARGKVYRELGRDEEAYDDFCRARELLELKLRRRDFDTQLQTQLGRILTMLGEYKEAERLYSKIIETAPLNTKQYAYKQLGELFEEQGMIDEAIQAYRNAIELLPSYLLAKKCLKRALQKK